MTTNVGANQSNTIAQNQTTSVGLNQTETVGAVKNVSVGGNFFTNIIGKMVEFVKGNIESHTDEERTVQSKNVGINSENHIQANASKKMQRFSGDQSNDS